VAEKVLAPTIVGLRENSFLRMKNETEQEEAEPRAYFAFFTLSGGSISEARDEK
jgi:hypothetical protein